MSKQEHAFVLALLEGKGKYEAAVDAGYAESGAASWATRALKRPQVQELLRSFYEREEELVGLDRERIRQRLMQAAMLDGSEVFDEEWRVLPNSEIPARARGSIIGARTWSGDQGSGSTVKLANPQEAQRIYLKFFAPPNIERGIILDEAAASLELKLDALAARLGAIEPESDAAA